MRRLILISFLVICSLKNCIHGFGIFNNLKRLISFNKAMSKKPCVVSGIQPTGNLHIGNYFGAMRQWVSNQDKYDNYFSIADLHAITSSYDPKKLSQQIIETAALYLAAGVDPIKSKLFIQSHVKAHTELTWLLNCITPINWLKQMLQFKVKSECSGNFSSVGLLDYPVLMTSDILLYGADFVPVGSDQKQHLQLARDIAQRFNYLYTTHDKPYFKLPEAMYDEEGSKIMSLENGLQKMSKSAMNDHSRINLLDSPDVIISKIKRGKTDSIIGLEWNNPQRPEAHNLLTIYRVMSGESIENIIEKFKSMPNSQFKSILADACIAFLSPLQERYKNIMTDKNYLEKVLAEGAESANEVAEKTVKEVKSLMGFTV